jgi:hypothetical protein
MTLRAPCVQILRAQHSLEGKRGEVCMSSGRVRWITFEWEIAGSSKFPLVSDEPLSAVVVIYGRSPEHTPCGLESRLELLYVLTC